MDFKAAYCTAFQDFSQFWLCKKKNLRKLNVLMRKIENITGIIGCFLMVQCFENVCTIPAPFGLAQFVDLLFGIDDCAAY